METGSNLEDDEPGEWVSYSTQMHDSIAPVIKKFLVDFVGERFYTFESETYRNIEEIIRDGFLFADQIPDDLHIHSTIINNDLYEEAFEKFTIKDAKFSWLKIPQWYDREFVNDDDVEFLESTPESELTEEQIKAKKIIEVADNMINYNIGFASFMKQGCELLIPAMQKFIEDTANFDLTILSHEGYKTIQDTLELIADYIFDRLYPLISA